MLRQTYEDGRRWRQQWRWRRWDLDSRSAQTKAAITINHDLYNCSDDTSDYFWSLAIVDSRDIYLHCDGNWAFFLSLARKRSSSVVTRWVSKPCRRAINKSHKSWPNWIPLLSSVPLIVDWLAWWSADKLLFLGYNVAQSVTTYYIVQTMTYGIHSVIQKQPMKIVS